MTDEKFMRIAISKAKEGIRNGQTPFGACIVKDDKVISCVHNTVWKDTDITAHAEINAIRMACKKLNSIDLTGCTIYTTSEPCPMCFGACHWAKISRIVYGTSIEDVKNIGFNELIISNRKIKSLTQNKIKIVGDFLRDECLELFKMWSCRKDKKTY
jgi:tRNA(Arg) A34 adenosine deaminase TadA